MLSPAPLASSPSEASAHEVGIAGLTSRLSQKLYAQTSGSVTSRSSPSALRYQRLALAETHGLSSQVLTQHDSALALASRKRPTHDMSVILSSLPSGALSDMSAQRGSLLSPPPLPSHPPPGRTQTEGRVAESRRDGKIRKENLSGRKNAPSGLLDPRRHGRGLSLGVPGLRRELALSSGASSPCRFFGQHSKHT